MFDLDSFIADCRAALREDASHKAVGEVVARAVSDPSAVIAAWANLSAARSRSSTTPTT